MLIGLIAQTAEAADEVVIKGAETVPEEGSFTLDTLLPKLIQIVTDNGLNLLAAIVIFFVGRAVARMIVGLVGKILEKRQVDPVVKSFTTNMLTAALMGFVFIAILRKLGVETTSLVAVIGAAGLAIGLALQGSLSNFAAGFLIIMFKPFKAGDFVEANGASGIIEDINIFTTELRTFDNKVVIVPNSKMTDDNVINYSSAGKRRVDLVVGIAYNASIDDARKILMDIMTSDNRVLSDPAPAVGVLELGDSSVNLAVRPWTAVENYWDVYFDTMESVKKRFDEGGIGIPFPQRDVHLYQESSDA